MKNRAERSRLHRNEKVLSALGTTAVMSGSRVAIGIGNLTNVAPTGIDIGSAAMSGTASEAVIGTVSGTEAVTVNVGTGDKWDEWTTFLFFKFDVCGKLFIQFVVVLLILE